MSLVSFIGPRPNLLGIDVTEPPMRLEAAAADPDAGQHGEDPARRALLRRRVQVGRARHLLSGGVGRERHGSRAREPRRARRGRDHARATTSSSCPIAACRPRMLPIPGAARHGRRARASGEEGLAHVDGARRRDRLGARGARLRAARGLRRRGDPSRTSRSRRSRSSRESVPGIDHKESYKRFIKAICKGLNKVMSKMGISTYQSYCGAQIFEAVGLQKAFVDKYFTGTASNVEGIGLFEVAEEAARLHALAFGDDPLLRDMLDAGGEYMYRMRGEAHMWTPESIAKLQHATRANSVRDVPRLREAHQRAEPRAEDVPRPVRASGRPSARRCRSRKSSRRRTSSSASPPAR